MLPIHSLEPSLWLSLPFILLLGAIALAPLLFPRWWHRHYQQVSLGSALFIILYYLLAFENLGRIEEALFDYISFLSIVLALFVITSGIHLRVSGESRPFYNTLFLLGGAILANVIGTTGASILLIRPWIRMNRFRYTTFHTVFFIFIVSNCGGALTPIGDPPLFLGFLRHIPFFWTLGLLWPAWAMTVGLLLIIFYLLDWVNFHKVEGEVASHLTAYERVGVEGCRNFFFLGVVLSAFFVSMPWRELIMLAAALISYLATPRAIYQANHFSWAPVREIGWLFLGIFITMMPALDYLKVHAHEWQSLTPVSYYYLTGGLSAILDNAPTYLSFLTLAVSRAVDPATGHVLSIHSAVDMRVFITQHTTTLIAISIGSVFFGAMTYIGNGPNLLVQSIVAQSGKKAPHFLECIYKYSLPFLLPVLMIVGYIVLR